MRQLPVIALLGVASAGCRIGFDERTGSLDAEAPSDGSAGTEDGTTDDSATADAAVCSAVIRYTVRDSNFTPSNRADGDARCASYWPQTHWCELAEMQDVDWHPHPAVNHAGNHPQGLGTRQLVYVAAGAGCGGSFSCSNIFINPAAAECMQPGCENVFCTNSEALVCCPD